MWLESKVKDTEKGQAIIKVRNVDFIIKSPLLVHYYLSGLFILESPWVLEFFST